MKQLTEEQLLELLMNYKRCAPVTLKIETEVDMYKFHRWEEKTETGEVLKLKQRNPYVGATCTKRINGMINFDYPNSVNYQRAREGKETDFNPYERKWGVHLTKCVIGHKGKYYLQVKLENTYGPFVYKHEGSEIAYSELELYVKPKKSYSRQGVDDEIEVRDVTLCNILQSTIDKEEYEIVR